MNDKKLIPEIVQLSAKTLVGKRLKMSFSENRTVDLWRSFMPRLKEINKRVSRDLFSMQLFGELPDFSKFNPDLMFEKWAAAEVSELENTPDGMEVFYLESGLYAVFAYKGAVSEAAVFFQYIFGTWLPGSEYALDNRPHFELLGEKYNNNSADSEENIFIPIKKRE
ncbi:MAG: GyrI-like domain-containing protein [Bacteroidota bacterium]